MAPKRVKGKPQPLPSEQEVGGEEAQRLKAAIEAGGGSLEALQPAQLLRVLKADKPCEGLYSKACKGGGKSSNANPNCLCHLLPAPGSHRKAGLWAKQTDVVATLGPDPADRARKDRSVPVGLKNLGNTCYVNSVLQCMFANAAFRRAVYALRPPVADEPIVKELRELFLSMEHGCCDPVDPEPLAKALNLDHGVQQDGQEFMKLFLTLLETKFAMQREVEGVIQDLFRGSSGYSTVCQTCKQPSESSARSDSFYELDVPVKGFKSLPESLTSITSAEFMDGDNQYHCDYCAKKVDATRQQELRSLPPVLCMSLRRFVFDFQRMDRIKVSDKFAFPLALDMAPFVGQQPGSMLYDLEAIMVHKGGSALAGHYVAHIKLDAPPALAAAAAAAEGTAEEGSKEEAAPPAKKQRGGKKAAAASSGPAGEPGPSWWRFDDDSVTELKGGPTASTDHGGAAGKAAAAAAADGKAAGGGKKGGGKKGGGKAGGGKGGRGGGKGGRGKKAASSEEDDEEEVEETAGDEDAELAAAMAASLADAQQAQQPPPPQPQAPPPPQQAQPQQAEQQQEIVSSNAYLLVYRRRGAELPQVPLDADQAAGPAAAARRMAEEAQAAADAYAASKAQLLERQAARQGEVRGVVETAAQLEDGDPGRFVTAEWLEQWANSGVEADPGGPIDNSPLLCPHSKLDPAKIGAARRISTLAWEQLQESCRGGPPLGPADACPACLAEQLDLIAAKEDTEEQYQQFLAIARELEGGQMPPESCSQDFFISQQWLKEFVKKRAPGTFPARSPTHQISCPCGALAPETAKDAKRVAVPEDFWRFVARGWRAQAAHKAQRQRQKAGGGGGGAAGGGGGGGSGVWEVVEGGEQQQAPQQPADAADVICIDGAAASAAEPAGGGRRGRRGRGAQPEPAAQPAVKAEDDIKIEDDSGEVVVIDSPTAPAVDGAGGGGELADAAAPASASTAADECREFAAGTPECPTCAGDLQAVSKALKGMQGRLAEEKQELAHLLPPPHLRAQGRQLAPGASYRLVPAEFMAQWRAYMSQAGKRGAPTKGAKAELIVQPPSLSEALAGVLCPCHRHTGPLLLAHKPPAVANRRGRWQLADDGAAQAAGGPDVTLADEGSAVYEVLDEADWNLLTVYYGEGSEGGGGGRRKRARQDGGHLDELLDLGISATLMVQGDDSPGAGAAGVHADASGDGAAGDADGAADEAPAARRPVRGSRVAALRGEAAAEEGDTSGSDGEYMEKGELVIGTSRNPYALKRRRTARQGAGGSGWFDTDPPVCSKAVEERQAELRAACLTYSQAEVVVEVVGSAEEALAPPGDAERKSKRARRGRAPVQADASTTLEVFKRLVWQTLGVHPGNAQLFLRGAALTAGDDATLAQCEVYPGDTIRVVDSGVHDSSDYASVLAFGVGPAQGGKGRREAERGFTGTALTGLPSGAPDGGSSGAGAAAGAASAEEGATGGREGAGPIDMDAELAAAAAAERDGELAGMMDD
ncbi:ubiquitin carboxyl-terminal hydrolase 26 [Micractinium conductrix]|uniref:ubiquitinyl hydrolase 1 n=1 Tax=Micractinium conductrix TaxID=554055 RepID=A0A2P6V3S3_9CHLO|nr:ubiquitin carboxyl-terminal hydrolase 26 [Micractinium conductrix]|eukprot:PSC68725.1 ubiquitin carboxyl-terminal hydrolase 26 [Micractinium conductrix]